MILAVTFVSICAIFYVYLVFAGRFIVSSQLESLTNKKTTIGALFVLPPANIIIRDLEIKDTAKAESIYVSVSPLMLLAGNIALNELSAVGLHVTLEKFPAPKETIPVSGGSGKAVSNNAKLEALRLPVVFKKIKITNGKLTFIDRTVGKDGVRISVKDIYVDIKNFYLYPLSSTATNFNISAKIPWLEGQEEGRVSFEGWLDAFKKDMRATLKVMGIDGVYLYPYYSQWVDLESSRIEKAKLNFVSDIQGLNNIINAKCDLRLTDITFKERAPEEPAQRGEVIAQAVLKKFKLENQRDIVCQFNYTTKMDRPEFSFGIIKGAVEEKFTEDRKRRQPLVGNVILLPVKLIEGTIKGTADIFRALVGGTFAIGNEVKKGVEGSFRK